MQRTDFQETLFDGGEISQPLLCLCGIQIVFFMSVSWCVVLQAEGIELPLLYCHFSVHVHGASL